MKQSPGLQSGSKKIDDKRPSQLAQIVSTELMNGIDGWGMLLPSVINMVGRENRNLSLRLYDKFRFSFH